MSCSPLYGRSTAQSPVDPLLFPALSEFLPSYSAAERVSVYAVTGGIAAYVERFNDTAGPGANIKRLQGIQGGQEDERSGRR